MKKRWLLFIAIIWLGGCYILGQYRYLDKERRSDVESVPYTTEFDNGVESKNIEKEILYSFSENFDVLSYQGKEKVSTDVNPWGETVAKIEDEEVGTAIMMTPNTFMTANYYVDDIEKISFQYKLHPWVVENSDGANLIIRVYTSDIEKAEIYYEYYVDSDEISTTIEVPLEQFAGKEINITFSVGSGENNDSSGDWVVLANLAIVKDKIDDEKNSYVKSAHYFSDEWPINFWNSEMDNLDLELHQIKVDGFDSIILVIPWREFQPTISPVSYNQYAWEKLRIVMQAAQEQDLNVMVRVGYTWDYYMDESENVTDRFYSITGDINTQNAWNQYVEKLYNVLKEYDNFMGGFVTWEDFWNNLNVCKAKLKQEESIEKARFMGYQDYVKNNYSLKEYNEEYGTRYSKFEDIMIPKIEDPDMKAFYEYYDHFLCNLLEESQNVFPNLSMEVRIDADLIYDRGGGKSNILLS